MKVIAQNGTPVNSVTPEDVVKLRKDMSELKVTPQRIDGISQDVLAVLTSPDQDAIRKAAGITDDQIDVQGPPGETPVIQVAGSELQAKLPSESDWRNIFDLSTLAGKDAEPAEDGKDGTGIASVDVTYQISNSGSTIPDGQWTSSAVAAPQSSYLWTRLCLTLTDGTSKDAYLVSRSAIDGMPGDDGEPGKNGSPGEPGESAYQTAVRKGFIGSESEWVASLHGEDGDDGKAGESPIMQVASGYIQEKLPSGSKWNNLVALADITGPANNLAVGNVTTLAAGSSATAEITGTSPSQKINFGIPVGNPGSPGTNGTNATTTASATKTTAGLMSATDKTKLDSLNAVASPVTTAVLANGRPIGTAFTLSLTRNASVTYTVAYSLTALLTLGQTVTISATVDGAEVARVTDAILLGLAGTINRSEVLSFDVPAGKAVLFTKTGTAGVTVTIACGQETLL